MLLHQALPLVLATVTLSAATHYSVRLTVDVEGQTITGDETIEFSRQPGVMRWTKQTGLTLTTPLSTKFQVEPQSVSISLSKPGTHRAHFQYRIQGPARGLHWLPNNMGLGTDFYCDAWMVCEPGPQERATLDLVVHLMGKDSVMTAVGPGRLVREFHNRDASSFHYRLSSPAQSFLFNFGVAKLERSDAGNLRIWLPSGNAATAFEQSRAAYTFLRQKAGIDWPDLSYTQLFLPGKGIGWGQEAAQLALMGQNDLEEMAATGNPGLLAHEMAHQWWGMLVGINSWSDFWLNEGFAQYMTIAYQERRLGRLDYDRAIADLRTRYATLEQNGKDRPLHFTGWRDAHDALSPIAYIKGALFLHQLREELGDDAFWRGIAAYTTANAGRLVDSHDFQDAVEKASGRSLEALFRAWVNY